MPLVLTDEVVVYILTHLTYYRNHHHHYHLHHHHHHHHHHHRHLPQTGLVRSPWQVFVKAQSIHQKMAVVQREKDSLPRGYIRPLEGSWLDAAKADTVADRLRWRFRRMVVCATKRTN